MVYHSEFHVIVMIVSAGMLAFIVLNNLTNINISELGEVEIDAVSSQYAQLGYFVSKLKLENIILDVNMTVVEMTQNIRIKIGGMLPW